MSYATLILGESGTGKTCSLRNLNPAECLLIQPTRKPLPFRSAGWREVRKKGDGGNIYVSDNAQKIISAMNLDLKLMKSYKSTADIKEASGGKGVAANYPGFRALQKIHMMRYKMYVKICSFVLPKE